MAHPDAAKLKHRVWVYKNVPTTNTDGQQVEVETEWFQAWVEIRPIRGKERFLAQQTTADVTHRVWMRSNTKSRDITPKHWLKLSDGTRLDIVRAFDVDLARREIELECNQRV